MLIGSSLNVARCPSAFRLSGDPMTFKVCVSSDAICEPARIFDLDDENQVNEYLDYVQYLTAFDDIIFLEEGEQVTITCIGRDD